MIFVALRVFGRESEPAKGRDNTADCRSGSTTSNRRSGSTAKSECCSKGAGYEEWTDDWEYAGKRCNTGKRAQGTADRRTLTNTLPHRVASDIICITLFHFATRISVDIGNIFRRDFFFVMQLVDCLLSGITRSKNSYGQFLHAGLKRYARSANQNATMQI